jgi:hypothetical protein
MLSLLYLIINFFSNEETARPKVDRLLHNHMMLPKARLVLRTARLPSRSIRFETSGYIELIAAAAKVAPATMPTLRPSVSVRIQFTPFRRIGLYVKAGAKHKAVCK